ncbi:Nitroreductase family protein [Amycolatopsis xylanica]|uniref:Nitroreductase family protein n=2 Tax=Amycolatopsis xylanica TaxID=589385 RepID=A0A1H3QV76_9PSEU|nr:Nitroreductase family protein [Amycolatopsis xylanica]
MPWRSPGPFDESIVREALTLAVRAPSPRNSQPWRWVVDGPTVHLYAGRDRQTLETDPNGPVLLFSCGTALHHLRIALAGLGWRTLVHRLPDAAEPELLATIELTRGEPTADEISLAAAIGRRRDDPRRYSDWKVPEAHLTWLSRCAKDSVSVELVRDGAVRPRLVHAIAEAERRRSVDPALLLELLEVNGLAWTSPTLDFDRESELFVLGTGSDDRQARLRAGEIASRVLLTATSLGLASCLLTTPLSIADTRAVLRAELLGGWFPQAVIRVGWAPVSAQPVPDEPRRSLDEIVQFAIKA